MPPFIVNPKSIRSFASEAAFEAWLAKNHETATEVWIKIFKKDSGKPSINASQAIDVVLCWGWIDGIRKGFDEDAFLQRYTPRKGRSRWSQINVERVQKLTKAGRMTPHGQRHIDAAKADGRWQAAYPSSKSMQLPPEFLAAVAERPKAQATLAALPRQDAYVMAYRLYHSEGERRATLSAKLLALLVRGDPAALAAWRGGKGAAPSPAPPGATKSKVAAKARKATKRPRKRV